MTEVKSKAMESSKLPAPTLTKAEQKKSISGTKKVQKRKVVLNTLDSPLDLDWPRIGIENEEEVKLLFAKHLSPVRASNVSISKEKIGLMSKEERVEWRNKEKEKAKLEVAESKPKMSDLLVGFRDVIKAAGKGQACVVFCEKTPDPPMLTRLFAPLCQSNGIPLFALKNFSLAVNQVLRVPRCLTMALKLSAKEASSPLNILYQRCMEIYQSCGLTVARPKISLATSTCLADTTREESDVQQPIVAKEKVTVTGPVERFYLPNKGPACRFVPGVTKNPLKTDDQTQSLGADFIALGAGPTPESAPVKIYRYHKIKQIIPNENKKKKKRGTLTEEPAPKKKK